MKVMVCMSCVPCHCVAVGMTLVVPVDHTKIHNVLVHMEMFRRFQMTLSGSFLHGTMD